MRLKDFIKTEEFLLVEKILNNKMGAGDREFVRAYFRTSEYCEDKELIEEIVSLLDECYNGNYQTIVREFSGKQCNSLLLLMKISSPYDIIVDFKNSIGWGFCRARTFWTLMAKGWVSRDGFDEEEEPEENEDYET
jgi:hypothetical protein